MRLSLYMLPLLALLLLAAAQLPAEPMQQPDATPTQVRYLTGVGVTAGTQNVNIRSGPGVFYPVIGRLLAGRALDVTGYNGYDLGRRCGPVFEDDLDMWVEVRFGEQIGWVARCTVTVEGDMTRLLVKAAPPLPYSR